MGVTGKGEAGQSGHGRGIVVGGRMASAGDLLLEPTRTGLRRHALDSVAQTPVVESRLGNRASLVGAVLLAADRTELVAL